MRLDLIMAGWGFIEHRLPLAESLSCFAAWSYS